MTTQTPRVLEIDALRGLAVCLMVMVHAAATWTPPSISRHSFLAYTISGLGGLAAPLFVTLMGWGIYRTHFTLRKRLVRGGGLLLLQLIVNLAAPHLFQPFTPGVLSLMGLMILTSGVWAIQPTSSSHSEKKLAGCMACVLLVCLVFPTIQGESIWAARVSTDSLNTLFSHLFFTGTYPLFPWLFFGWLGGLLSFKPEIIQPTLIIGGCITMASMLYAGYSRTPWALPTGNAVLTFFPANPFFLVAAMTGTLLLWMLFHRISPSKSLAHTGRTSLTIYVLHFVPLAKFHTLETTQGWSISVTTVAILTFTLVWIPVSLLLQNKFRQLTLEYQLQRLV